MYLVDRETSTRPGASTRIVRQILRNEGGISSFYRGLVPNLVGNSVSWALYFLWYDKLKNGLSAYHGSNQRLSYYDYFGASGIAGLLVPGAFAILTADIGCRTPDGSLHKPYLGNQNPHAFYVCKPPWRIHIHY